jgi:hypothetical protein
VKFKTVEEMQERVKPSKNWTLVRVAEAPDGGAFVAEYLTGALGVIPDAPGAVVFLFIGISVAAEWALIRDDVVAAVIR